MPDNGTGDIRQDTNNLTNKAQHPIIRNIKESSIPICSYEAGLYNENYNEGNIVGFKSRGTGEIYTKTYLQDDNSDDIYMFI